MFMSGLFPQPPEFIEMKEKPFHKISEQNTIVFEILPALSVLQGSPVKAVTDCYKNFTAPLEEVILFLFSKYDKLLIVDYDGLLKNKPQIELIQSIQEAANDSDKDIELWVEAGVRYADGMIDLFIAGANSVVISTSLIASYKELKKVFEMSGDIILSIDFCDGKIVSASKVIRQMNPEHFIDKCLDMGFKKIIIDNVVTDDSSADTDIPKYDTEQLLKKFAKNSCDIYMHTDSTSLEKEQNKFKDLGLRGFILDISEEDIH